MNTGYSNIRSQPYLGVLPTPAQLKGTDSDDLTTCHSRT